MKLAVTTKRVNADNIRIKTELWAFQILAWGE